MDKLLVFKYITEKLKEWHEDLNPFADSDFSVLKLIKLHFFVSAISSDIEEDNDLLEIFDNFYAMPYGPVESNIYDEIKHLKFQDISEELLRDFNIQNLDFHVKKVVDDSIAELKNRNIELVNMEAFDLVELSHQWDCWKATYVEARSMGNFSMPIPKNLIRSEFKYFG